MSDALTWTNEQRRLSDLVPWDKNPRQINKEQARRLRQSLAEFGQVQAICIDPDNMIIDGHQRKAVWGMADEYGMDYVVDVRVASRKLTDKEQQKLTIFLGKGAAGEWDFDALANFFQVDDLIEWGFKEYELGIAPDDTEWADAFGGLPDEDRAPFQQMTFTLHDIQVEQVKDALAVSKAMGEFVDSENENSNGNALARIVEIFLTDYGQR